MKQLNQPQPIIVRRIVKKGKPHGGAWKVAFADFAVAMMAFFLVLWLSESASPEQKEAISSYFEDPIGFTEGGSPSVIDLGGAVSIQVVDDPDAIPISQPEIKLEESQAQDIVDQVEHRKLYSLMNVILEQIERSPTLREYKDQLKLDITDEGLRIQIVDKQGRPMFDTGSAELKEYSREIINELAPTISRVDNRLVVSGHTDARPFPGFAGYSNWELSSDRANAARRALVEGGLPEDHISRVVGLASSSLYDSTEPYNPINRRITILVLNRRAALIMEDAEQVKPGRDQILPKASPPVPPPVAKPSGAAGRSSSAAARSTDDILQRLDGRGLTQDREEQPARPAPSKPVPAEPAPDSLAW